MGLEGVVGRGGVGGIWGRRMEGGGGGGGGGRQTIFGGGRSRICFLVCLLGDEEEWMSWMWELERLKGFFDVGSELELIISSHQRVSAANCREP